MKSRTWAIITTLLSITAYVHGFGYAYAATVKLPYYAEFCTSVAVTTTFAAIATWAMFVVTKLGATS